MALMEWGVVDTDAFSTTVVDLAQRGYLTIEETEDDDHRFTATDKPATGLLGLREQVLTKLFEDGRPDQPEGADRWAKADRTDAAAG